MYRVSQKNPRRLNNNRTKAIFKISFILNKAQSNVDFEIKIVEIR